MSPPLGQHLLLDIHDIEPSRLCDADSLATLLHHAAIAAGATPIHAHFHSFGAGQGITGVLLLRESHISLHTWPEHRFAALDIFMCGNARPELAAAAICEGLGGSATQRVMGRGACAEALTAS